MDHADREEIISQIRRCLTGTEDVLFGYLYGFFLHHDKFHDIDIGLYISGRENPTSSTSTHTTEVASTLPVWIVEDLAGMLNDKPVLVDLRGIFDEEETEKVGFYYGRL